MEQKDLDQYTVEELKEVADAEGVQLRSDMLKADIVSAIEKHRAAAGTSAGPGAKPGAAPKPETVDHAAESVRLTKEDRERFDRQGSKEPVA
jgi:hypothetical protein